MPTSRGQYLAMISDGRLCRCPNVAVGCRQQGDLGNVGANGGVRVAANHLSYRYGFFLLLLDAAPAWAPGSIEFHEVMNFARQNQKLVREIETTMKQEKV
jgi:hypothetical protein